MRTIEGNADRDVISYNLQTYDFLHIAVKSIEKPSHISAVPLYASTFEVF